jgi:hypothetical protein
MRYRLHDDRKAKERKGRYQIRAYGRLVLFPAHSDARLFTTFAVLRGTTGSRSSTSWACGGSCSSARPATSTSMATA